MRYAPILRFIKVGVCLLGMSLICHAGSYLNPQVHAVPDRVALTFDLCDGSTDVELLELLWKNQEPVTLFVTAKWMRKNPERVAWLKDKQSVFAIENHGLNHRQAVMTEPPLYGLTATQTEAATRAEADDGGKAIEEVFGHKPIWFRSAGAAWDEASVRTLAGHWFLAGYTVNGDEGAQANEHHIKSILAKVKGGDVVLFHANHPKGQTQEALRVWLQSSHRPRLGLLRLPNF